MVWFVSFFVRSEERIEADYRQDAFMVDRSGRWLWLRDERRIPFDSVREATVTIRGREGHLQQIRWQQIYGTEIGHKDLMLHFRVRGVEHRQEALSLCFALSHILGLSGYRFARNDHLQTELQLQRSSVDEGIAHIPMVRELSAALASNRVDSVSSTGEIDAPIIELPPFDPESFRVALHFLRRSEIQWKPGELVYLSASPLPIGWRIAGAVFIGAIAGIVLTLFLGGLFTYLIELAGLRIPWWVWSVPIGLIAAGCTWKRIARVYTGRDIVFDWNKRVARLRIGKKQQQHPFSQVRGIAVQGYRERLSDKPDRYLCDIFLMLVTGEQRIVTSDDETDRDGVYRKSAALAAELAHSLGVEWEWRGYRSLGGVERLIRTDR